MSDEYKIGVLADKVDQRFDYAIRRAKILSNMSNFSVEILRVDYKNRFRSVGFWIEENRIDLLFLPLSLPNFISLQVAEHIFVRKLSTKTVLCTASRVIDDETSNKLFNVRADSSVIGYWRPDRVPNITTNIEDIYASIGHLLKTEPALAKRRSPIMHGGAIAETWTVDDYIRMKTDEKFIVEGTDIYGERPDRTVDRPPAKPKTEIEMNFTATDRRFFGDPMGLSSDAQINERGKRRLLFLHGLGGHASLTWGKFPEYVMSDHELSCYYEPDFFSYPTSLVRLPFTGRAPKVQELAAGLRTQIEHDKFEEVDLVCHSLGGLIARRYLIEEVKANRPLRVKNLMLFAVPNNGSGLASVARYVSWKQNQIKQLCKDADIIEILNEDWFNLRIQNKVRTKFVIGTQDEVVDRFSVASYWGNPDVETIVGQNHISIVKPNSQSDMSVKILRKFLLAH